MGLSFDASSPAFSSRLLGCGRRWLAAALLVGTAHAQRVNLAKYQTVAASSQNTTYLADFATDGIVSNFHSLRTNNITGSFFTLEVSYPKPVTVASAHLYTGLLETASATQILPGYRYQYFDGAAWVTITSVLNNTAAEVATTFPQAVTASRFRLLGVSNGVFTIRELAFFPPNLAGGVEQGYPLGTDVTLNLAYKQPAAASSAQLVNPNGPGYAKNAFDGYLDNRSRWLVAPVNNVYAAGETLEVDLLSTHAVGAAHVYSGVMNASRVSSSPIPDFTLQYWDGAAWQPIPGAAIAGNTLAARAIEFASPVSTSKIRLLTTGATPARLQELLLFPPRAGGTPLGREVVDAAPPTDTYERYSDSFYRIRNTGPDFRIGLVNGAVVNVPADPVFPGRTEWQLLLNHRDGTYRVRNADTGLCLALGQLGTAAGIPVVAEEYTALPHQDWRLVYNAATPAQFALVSAYSGHAIQPLNNSWSSGAPLVVAPYNSALNLQFWTASLRRAHPKKGVAATNSLIGARYAAAPGLTYHQDYYNRLNGFWSYTWNRQSSDSFPYLAADFTYNPMQWGDFGWDHGNASRIPIERNHRDLQETGKPVALLGFNEPEHEEQGYITVDDAIARWPRLEARDVPLVSPAPANINGTWFQDFVAKADARGYRRDYTAVHWYAAPNANSLITQLTNVYNDFGRPVWLTEFGNTRWSGTATWTEADTFNFLAEFLWRAESLTWLKRYSIFGYIEEAPGSPDPVSPDPAEAPRSNILRYDGTLTPLGQLYAGWDGVTGVVNDTAYHLHNHGAYLRAINPGADSGPAGISPDSDIAGIQWFLSPGATANTVRILSTRDGRPLRYVDGVSAPVTLGAAGETGLAVEWSFTADQYGRYYLQHPASANKRLRLNANGGYAMVASTDTGDLSKWRFIRPAASDPVGAPAAPSGLSASAAGTSVTLAWSAVSSPAAAYIVERASALAGPWTRVANGLAVTTWTDTGLAPATAYHYRVTATNLYALASAPSGIASATTPAANLYAAWNSGIAWNGADGSANADPDRDGLPNLLEYALAANPLASTPAPSVRIASGLPSRLALDFTRIADPALTYTVEASSDLAAWTPVWTSTGAQNLAGPVAVADAADLASNPRRFLRLKITLP